MMQCLLHPLAHWRGYTECRCIDHGYIEQCRIYVTAWGVGDRCCVSAHVTNVVTIIVIFTLLCHRCRGRNRCMEGWAGRTDGSAIPIQSEMDRSKSEQEPFPPRGKTNHSESERGRFLPRGDMNHSESESVSRGLPWPLSAGRLQMEEVAFLLRLNVPADSSSKNPHLWEPIFSGRSVLVGGAILLVRMYFHLHLLGSDTNAWWTTAWPPLWPPHHPSLLTRDGCLVISEVGTIPGGQNRTQAQPRSVSRERWGSLESQGQEPFGNLSHADPLGPPRLGAREAREQVGAFFMGGRTDINRLSLLCSVKSHVQVCVCVCLVWSSKPEGQ